MTRRGPGRRGEAQPAPCRQGWCYERQVPPSAPPELLDQPPTRHWLLQSSDGEQHAPRVNNKLSTSRAIYTSYKKG